MWENFKDGRMQVDHSFKTLFFLWNTIGDDFKKFKFTIQSLKNTAMSCS